MGLDRWGGLQKRIYSVYAWFVDTHYSYQGQLFEWDSEKEVVNLLKHGVSFEKACEVFFDPFVCIVDATDRDDMKMLFVVHLVRGAEALESFRIVSARTTTPQERQHYENQ